jgi:PilZ domain
MFAGVEASERRRYRRAPVDVFANRFQQGYPYLCRATDISRKGMRLRTFNEPHLPASALSGLQFQLPGSADVITASAEVVFEDQASGVLGIRFLHLSKNAHAAIDGYLTRTRAAGRPPAGSGKLSTNPRVACAERA